MLKDTYCYPCSVEQIGKMNSNVALGIDRDKEWKNNMGVKIFKIKLSNILQRNEWLEQLVNCSVKCKVYRHLKITETSNQSLKKKRIKEAIEWHVEIYYSGISFCLC